MSASNDRIRNLGEKIFRAVEEISQGQDIAVTNRNFGFDFARLFKLSEGEFSADCLVVEKIFPIKICDTMKVSVKKESDKAKELKLKILKLTSSADKQKNEEKKIEAFKKIAKLSIDYKNTPLIEDEEDILVCNPFTGQDNIFLVGLKEDNMATYKSFCDQMALFAYTYYSTLLMEPAVRLDFDVIVINNVSSIDVVCKVKQRLF